MNFNTIPVIFLLSVSWNQADAQLQRFQEHTRIGYKDASGKVIVPAIYTAGSNMKAGYAVVLEGDKRGYIDATGRQTIPCSFDDASPFEEGLACVSKAGMYGFIRTSGEWAITPVYQNAFSFSNGLARVQRNGRWGMIDRKGKVIIPFLYRRLGDLHDGLVIAAIEDGKIGYLTAQGNVAIEFKYRDAFPFDTKLHQAIVVLPDGKYRIDRKGAVLGKVYDEKEEEEAEERKAFSDGAKHRNDNGKH